MDFIRSQNTPYFSWDFDSKNVIPGPLSYRDFPETGPRGPFLESPGNFTGPKSNIQIEI